MMILAGRELFSYVVPVEIYKEAPCGTSRRRRKPPHEGSSGEREIAQGIKIGNTGRRAVSRLFKVSTGLEGFGQRKTTKQGCLRQDLHGGTLMAPQGGGAGPPYTLLHGRNSAILPREK